MPVWRSVTRSQTPFSRRTAALDPRGGGHGWRFSAKFVGHIAKGNVILSRHPTRSRMFAMGVPLIGVGVRQT